MLRTYSELSKLKTFDERFRYLELHGLVGEETFGFDRYLNQKFYKSEEWLRIRARVVSRDNGCDLGLEDYDIPGKILIHHMNPITQSDILCRNPEILNPEFLICVSHKTHNAIHYGDESVLQTRTVIERKPFDTCPWKRGESKNVR